MKIRWLFVLSVIGALAGIGAAIYYARQRPPLPPVFQPAANPYATGIYANGIVESDQPSGANLNLYAEVSGTVARIAVQEGQAVKRGDSDAVFERICALHKGRVMLAKLLPRLRSGCSAASSLVLAVMRHAPGLLISGAKDRDAGIAAAGLDETSLDSAAQLANEAATAVASLNYNATSSSSVVVPGRASARPRASSRAPID